MGKIIGFIIAIAVLIIILVLIGNSSQPGNIGGDLNDILESPQATPDAQANQTDETTIEATNEEFLAQLAIVLETDEPLGDPNAPITLVEFGDYQCTFCNKFFNESLPTIKRDYVDTGKVNLVFRDNAVNGPESVTAARATVCADEQGAFWPYHDKLFEERTGYNDGTFSRDNLIRYAGEIGLDKGTFEQCYDSGRPKAEIDADQADARRAGAQGTPTFFVITPDNQIGRIPGAQPLATWTDIFDQIVANNN